MFEFGVLSSNGFPSLTTQIWSECFSMLTGDSMFYLPSVKGECTEPIKERKIKKGVGRNGC